MKNWKDGEPIDGAYYAVRFRQGDELFEASSEAMPENGLAVFGTVKRIMTEAWARYRLR